MKSTNYTIMHVQSTDLECQAILNFGLQIDAQTTLQIPLVEPIFESEAAIQWSHKVKVSKCFWELDRFLTKSWNFIIVEL